jgi:hypothetical protein
MIAVRRHSSVVSATHSQIAFALIVVLACMVFAPRAAGDTPPGPTTGQTTTGPAPVTNPVTGVTPQPDPAPPPKKTPPPTPSRSTPVRHSAPPSHKATPVQPTPAFVTPTPAAPAAPAAVTSTPHRIAKTHTRAAPAKHHPAPSSALEGPATSSAVQQQATKPPASSPSTAPSEAPPPTAPLRRVGTHNSVARDLVVLIDIVAVLLLTLALIPAAVLRSPLVVRRAVRLRPSIAAAGISLLSASLILFMLNLSGPVP